MCDRNGCDNPGEFRPTLLVTDGAGKSARMLLGLKICGPCSLAARPEDYICDEGWGMIADAMWITVKVRARRELTKLEFVKCG